MASRKCFMTGLVNICHRHYCSSATVNTGATTCHHHLQQQATGSCPHLNKQSVSPAHEQHPAAAAKPISALPGPPPWPLLGNFVMYLKKENRNRIHEALAEQHKVYGPMFKEKLGPITQVQVCDPAMIEQVMRNHGRFPNRPGFPSWQTYRKLRGEAMGLLTSEGEHWWKLRQAFNQRTMNMKLVSEYVAEMNEVLDDFVSRIRRLRDGRTGDVTADGRTVPRLPNEIYKWAFESLGTVVFETRMGCLGDRIPPRADKLIDAIERMLQTSVMIMVGEQLHRKLNTRFWQRHLQAWDDMFASAKYYVDKRLSDLQKVYDEKQELPAEASFITHLLGQGQLTMSEIYGSFTELLLGGIDTSSNTLCFALYLLSQHPEVQEKVFDEVQRVTKGDTPDAAHLAQLRYVKNVVKETLRMYPVVTMNVRILEDDLVVNGHYFPKKTQVCMNHWAASRNPAVFHDADSFRPERWAREDGEKFHRFASLPFGYGVRSCVGRRIAEQELYLALCRISQEFVLEPHDRYELQPFLRTLLSPGEQLPVAFVDRKRGQGQTPRD